MDIETLIDQSYELSAEVANTFTSTPVLDSPREVCSRLLCELSFEQGQSSLILICHDAQSSAISLIRLQYESLVRSIWVHRCASEAAVKKLISGVTLDDYFKPEKTPMLSDMLRQLDGHIPNTLMSMLNELKDSMWKMMGSHVHGGRHAIATAGLGVPEHNMFQLIKVSNGLKTMLVTQIGLISGSHLDTSLILRLGSEYENCLPPRR